MTVTEQNLDLPEISGKVTVRVKTNKHKIAKISSDFDIERDKDNLVAVPLPDTPSMVEEMMDEIKSIHQEFSNFRTRTDIQIKEAVEKERRDIEEKINIRFNEMEKALRHERSKIVTIFGTLMIIKIWSKMVYDEVPKNNNRTFKDFFDNLIHHFRKEDEFDKNMKDHLKFSNDDIDSITDLVADRNFHAHGECEFFQFLYSSNTRAIKRIFENLKRAIKEAEEYENKDSCIIKIACAFLSNLHQALLKKNLLTE